MTRTQDRILLALGAGSVILASAIVCWRERAQGAGCFEDEAEIRFVDRTTCYAYDNLPIELRYYVAPEHWRDEKGNPR